MGKRQKIDVNNVFLPEALDEKDKQYVMKSAGWPLVVAAHSTTEQQVFVAGLARHSVLGSHTIHMTNKSGVNVCAIKINDEGKLSEFCRVDNPLSNCNSKGFEFEVPHTFYTQLLKTDSVRYAMNALRKNSTHRAKDDLIEALHRADRVVSEYVHDIISDILHVHNNNDYPAPPTVRLNNDTQIALLRMFEGDLSKDALPFEYQDILNKTFQTWQKEATNFRNVFNQAIEFFNTDKWIVFRMNGGVVLGVMSRHTALAQLEKCRDTFDSSVPRDMNYLDMSHPYRWYKNLNDIPAEIRHELNLSLVMLKAHLPQNTDYDIERDLLPNKADHESRKDRVWTSIGAARNHQWHNHTPFYLISK